MNRRYRFLSSTSNATFYRLVSQLTCESNRLTYQAEQEPNQKLINAAGNDYLSSVLLVPTLTCFIPSMDSGHPFRISIHSWDAPKMSQLMDTFKPSPDRVAFELRLIVDGELKCQKVVSLRKVWPDVMSRLAILGICNQADIVQDTAETLWTEYPKRLLFPPFHPELLQQAHWDAADGLGRIKLVISEGLAVSDGNGETINFHKLRDIVVFSFQHAPREILEKTQIAWPSAAMFQKAAMLFQQPDASVHAHSPSRSGKHKTDRNVLKPTINHPGEWSLKQPRAEEDPFIGPAKSLMYKPSRKLASDVTMADFPTTRTQSEMSDIKLQQPDFQQQVNRAAIDEIVRALTPRKRAALLNALSPMDLPSSSFSQPKTLPHSRIVTVKAFDPTIRPRSAIGNLRRSSNESQRSTSGNSTIMSWDETPTLGDLWSNSKTNEFPGLLPSIQNSAFSDGPSDSGRRRKRSPSHTLPPQAGDAFARAIEEMSTSPCKKSPTPAKRPRVEDYESDEANHSSKTSN